MQKYTFKEREKAVEFLEQFGFKYYVPRLEEEMDAVPVKNKFYHIEIVNNKVSFCCIDRIAYSTYSFHVAVFYDNSYAYRFSKKEAGEANYKEWLEYHEALFAEEI